MMAEMTIRQTLPRAALLGGLAFVSMSGAILFLHQREQASAVQLLPGLTFAEEASSVGHAPKQANLIVTSIQSDGAAETAGIKVGDVIDQVNGEKIVSAQDVERAVPLDAAPKIVLRIKRQGVLMERDLPAPHHIATTD